MHPGGKLGALLKVVAEFMHSGEAVPLTPLGTRMSDAILVIPAKGFGCVGITDAGDKLSASSPTATSPPYAQRPARRAHRRRDDAGAEDGAAGSVDQRDAGAANSTQVTALFAVEAGKPVGVIHIHDLLRAGAA